MDDSRRWMDGECTGLMVCRALVAGDADDQAK